MRLSITVLVAFQASMGLAHVIPPYSNEHIIDEENHSLSDLYKKILSGFEMTKTTTSHRFLGPESDEYESKKYHGHDEHGPKGYHPQDHEPEESHDTTVKYSPKEDHATKDCDSKDYSHHEGCKHEQHYDYTDKYSKPEQNHHSKYYGAKIYYPDKDHGYKKTYSTEKFDPFNDHYGLNKQQFDKYFTKDDHEPSEKDKPKKSHESKAYSVKRWPPNNHRLKWWNPRPLGRFDTQSAEYYKDPNEEHIHSSKFQEKPEIPEAPKSHKDKYTLKDLHDMNEEKEHEMDIFKPGFHSPKKYDAENEDEKLSHFHKFEQENDNRAYYDKFYEKYLPKQRWDSRRKTIPKSEYGGEDDHDHSVEFEDQYHARKDYDKPDYDKEDEEEYGDDSENSEAPNRGYSEIAEDDSAPKGLYGLKFGHYPQEELSPSEEAHENVQFGGSDEPKSYKYKKYYPKEAEEEDSSHTEAEKYGYRRYSPKEESDKNNHSDKHKNHDHEKSHKEKEDKMYTSKRLYFPNHHEPKESTKYYRKQEAGHKDNGPKKQPSSEKKDEHYGYYDEPGYENVIPGFMWAGPGMVTKTPCAKREGCPYGHWYMLEPKNGEHRRIGMTGTNIVVEPDYTRSDYKEDTVNHVLPGYEKVVPGFEWAGPGQVTEVPCPSVTDCPQGGWFMLAPKLGEHRRIAMNYPKVTPTPHPRPAPQPTLHGHKSDYKPRSPVGYEGGGFENDHGEDENERDYKLIHRHSRNFAKRSIEARAPCKKKNPKEGKEGKEGKKDEKTDSKKIDPNKPLPRLTTTHLLNIERLSGEKRNDFVNIMGPVMDEQFKKDFLTFKELTPPLITKLNELYALLLEDPRAEPILNFIKRRPGYVPEERRRSPQTPELTEKEIKKIEALPPAIRQAVAKKLGFDSKLTTELANADELSDDLIAKLNKEYARVIDDPKYAGLVKKFLSQSKSKRAEPELTEKEIKKIEALPSAIRQAVGKKLGFGSKLTTELANADKLSDDLIAKLNKEYARVMDDPKYAGLVKKFLSQSKLKRAEPKLTREMLRKVEGMSPGMRMMAAKKLDMDSELVTEMANADKFTPELIAKLNKEYARIVKDPQYRSILDKIGFKHKRAEEAPELSKAQLEKIEGMSPTMRMMAAQKLGMAASLATELANADSFTSELIKKLNKEYARVYNDPKYKDIIEKFSSKRKRFTRQLTEQQLDMIRNMSQGERRLISDTLNFKEDLATEFIRGENFTPHLVNQLNEVYTQIFGGRKYHQLVDIFEPKWKRQIDSDPKEETEQDAKASDDTVNDVKFNVDLTGEFLFAKELTESLIEKLGKLIHDTVVEIEWEELLENFIEEDQTPEDEEEASDTQQTTVDTEDSPTANVTKTAEAPAINNRNTTNLPEDAVIRDQETTKLLEEEIASLRTATKALGNETVSSQNATELPERQAVSISMTKETSDEKPSSSQNTANNDLDAKLEQSKKNGWCNEFLGTLKDTWNDSVEDAGAKVEETNGW